MYFPTLPKFRGIFQVQYKLSSIDSVFGLMLITIVFKTKPKKKTLKNQGNVEALVIYKSFHINYFVY